MGQRGPAPRPTALKVLQGDRKDRINSAEPVPQGDVVAPATLSAGALDVWTRLAPDLKRQGVLTAWDVDEFAVLCDAVARHRKAAEQLDAEGELGENRFGERVVRPWFRVWADTAAVISKFGGRFGLSPSDRQGLVMSNGTKPADDLLTG